MREGQGSYESRKHAGWTVGRVGSLGSEVGVKGRGRGAQKRGARPRGYLVIEAGTAPAVQTGQDERQRDDAGNACLHQVQPLRQVERRAHLAVGKGAQEGSGDSSERLG